MAIPARLTQRLRPLMSSAIRSRSIASASRTAGEEWPQRTPLGSYYESILNAPSPRQRPYESSASTNHVASPSERKPTDNLRTDTASSPARSFQTEPSATQTKEERIRNIFGSRVPSPEEIASRLATRTSQSTVIAGVRVPPKPEEPDNCCMSGCVNCVWELFREEMEEWAVKNTQAQRALANASAASASASAASVNDDGGGSETNWDVPEPKIAKDMWAKDVFDKVPVGIREFMKQEKRLKEMHERKSSAGN
ncbi:oxidoreductase-like protein [Dactylonectria estremocensis]|uniref:Oxidoreductase-like protein n=1 Tax=Dactylonectria estremocensis TaxID=1079267 RepID=A0A9P9FBM0_9HYPO|nr:oxidoreductase-like protein [Dactylonectria estremocensis]